MKATKKIVGAACALVAAVALSAGSTYAWFSSNDKVEVTGMHLQAVVPDALFIKEGLQTSVANITDTSLAYTDNSDTKLNPATIAAKSEATGTFEVKSAKTYSSNPTGGTAGTADSYDVQGTFNNSSTTIAPNESSVPANYAKMYVMSVARINNKTGAKLNAKVVFTFDDSNGDNTYQFVRCGFLTKENKFVTIDNEEAAGSCDYSTSAKTVTFTYENTNAVVSSFDGNTAYGIQFVVWFEGSDKDCYVNNALSTHKISVQITYSVTDAA